MLGFVIVALNSRKNFRACRPGQRSTSNIAFMVTVMPSVLLLTVPQDFFGGNTNEGPLGEMATVMMAMPTIGLSTDIYEIVIAGPLTGRFPWFDVRFLLVVQFFSSPVPRVSLVVNIIFTELVIDAFRFPGGDDNWRPRTLSDDDLLGLFADDNLLRLLADDDSLLRLLADDNGLLRQREVFGGARVRLDLVRVIVTASVLLKETLSLVQVVIGFFLIVRTARPVADSSDSTRWRATAIDILIELTLALALANDDRHVAAR
jgi:hypothetical protein